MAFSVKKSQGDATRTLPSKPLLDRMEIAEDEISGDKKRHPKHADRFHQSFAFYSCPRSSTALPMTSTAFVPVISESLIGWRVAEPPYLIAPNRRCGSRAARSAPLEPSPFLHSLLLARARGDSESSRPRPHEQPRNALHVFSNQSFTQHGRTREPSRFLVGRGLGPQCPPRSRRAFQS